MTHSMTAFARQSATHPWGTLIWEIRSVNHRYLEPSFKLPDALRGLESELRERLRTRLSRGKIECTLRTQLLQERGGALAIDSEVLEQVLACAQQVQTKIAQAAALNPLDVLAWPGVLKTEQQNEEVIAAAANELFDAALSQLIEHRAREGAELRRYIETQLAEVATIVDGVRAQMPTILAALRQRLRDRLTELRTELDNDRLEQEMVILAQKSDVAEELDRLQTHIKEVRHALQKSEPCGRRLDFLMQEFNREANTLSSKSQVSDTTLNAVRLKVLIEQMREQIQNIE
ncbi:MAG TPA: YicC/YloC family endoribonuclease [Spongiibacteraceae bacterium]|nr:YicC/YloC family endoribonuclease [Spongiibacteraceae bacterium]